MHVAESDLESLEFALNLPRVLRGKARLAALAFMLAPLEFRTVAASLTESAGDFATVGRDAASERARPHNISKDGFITLFILEQVIWGPPVLEFLVGVEWADSNSDGVEVPITSGKTDRVQTRSEQKLLPTLERR